MSEKDVPQTRILLFQTEAVDCLLDAVEVLRNESVFSSARFLLVCSDADHKAFEATEKFEKIYTYSKRGGLRRLSELKKVIAEFDPDVSCAIFSGRPIFRVPKLVFLVLSPRPRYIIDARMEGYWLTPASFRRIFLKDQEAMARYSGESSKALRTLLIETEASDAVERAIQIITRPDVVPGARISLFCGLERAARFEGNPALDEIYVYNKESLRADLRVIWSLVRSRPDVVVAIFSGRRIFLKQKLLFWLIPARARLAFNEHNDCAYISRWDAFGLVRIERPGLPLEGSISQRLAQIIPLRLILKGLLLLPRLTYLLIWVTLMKLLRAYRLEKLARYTSPRN